MAPKPLMQKSERLNMSKIYKIRVNEGAGGESQIIQITQSVNNKDAPLRIMARRGVRYELQDEAKGSGAAPDQVRVKRDGKNLTLMFDGSQNVDVVLENFYAVGSVNDGSLPVLAGLAENGGVYEYIPQDPALSSVTQALVDGKAPVLMALGGGALGETFALAALPVVTAAAAAGGIGGWTVAAGVLGAAALAGGGGGGGGGAGAGPGGDNAQADVTAPSQAALAVPEAANGGVNAIEANDGIALEITWPADAVVGDTVTSVLTKPDGSKESLTHVLTADDFKNKSLVQRIAAAQLKDKNDKYMDGTWTVVTTMMNAAKNVSKPAQTTFMLDTTAPETDTQNPLNPSPGKASLTLDEVPSTGMVSGTARGDFTAGDEVTLKINDKNYTSKVGADGKFSIQVPYQELVADLDKTIDASLAAHDAAGNMGTVNSSKPYLVDVKPPRFESSVVANAVLENIEAGSLVHQVKATDVGFVAPATADTVSYSLQAGNDSGAFTIDAKSGQVKLTTSPNYETKANYTFVVIAKDAVGNMAEQTITLEIRNVDEVAPTITSSDTPAPVNENISKETVVYQVLATDTDFNSPATKQSVIYKLKRGGDADALTINNSTGELRLKESPNFEAKNSYVFTVQAEDAVGQVSEKAVTLRVLNTPEAAQLSFEKEPGAFTGKTSVLAETWSVQVEDQDSGEAKLYSTQNETGTYGKFEYDAAKSAGDVFAWKYTLDPISGNAKNEKLDALTTTAHDLQVVRSFDGLAYRTIDVAINTGVNDGTQIFNTKNTVGLTVDGSASYKDTLVLNGLTEPSLTLDLTRDTQAAEHTKLSSIETIDLTGANNYTVKLNMSSLMQADQDGGIHKLFVRGGSADTVHVAGRGTIGKETAGAYDLYVFDNTHQLLVQSGMDVVFQA